jgi:AcrR family transcriptional regulator
VTWERARKPEQKAVRRKAILDAARTLFAELQYEEISLNGIAREAGLSKPSVYTYFSSREEIFLTIFAEEQESFLRSVTKRLGRIRSKDAVARVSRVWVEAALAHETMLHLLPLVMSSLERNSSAEQIVEFSQNGQALIGKLVQALARVDLGLDREQWTLFVQCSTSLIAGMWPIANPAENIREALDRAQLKVEKWDFATLMRRSLAALIIGIREQGSDYRSD